MQCRDLRPWYAMQRPDVQMPGEYMQPVRAAGNDAIGFGEPGGRGVPSCPSPLQSRGHDESRVPVFS